MPEPRIPMLALLTDFGAADPWIAELKAALWTIQPDFKILDVSHEVPRHDIVAGAFALYRSYRNFPPWTIHFTIVDPGVGGPRRPILVVTDDRYFIGPDNGVFSYVYERDLVHSVYHITSSHYFRSPLSETFHARDLFAPVAAWLSKGIESARFGEQIEDYVKVPVPLDRIEGDSMIKGEICAIDRFGNLVTNIHRSTLQALAQKAGKQRFKLLLSGQEIPLVSGGYSQTVPIFALLGSADLVEIACGSRPASQALGITQRGKELDVMMW